MEYNVKRQKKVDLAILRVSTKLDLIYLMYLFIRIDLDDGWNKLREMTSYSVD